MENKNGQGIFYGVIGVATLIVAIIGATFAYFSASATAGGNGAISGQTLGGSDGGVLGLTVNKITFDSTTAASLDLVPTDITTATAQTAVTAKCESTTGVTGDNSGTKYTGCHLYRVVATAGSNVNATLNLTTLTLTGVTDTAKWHYAMWSTADVKTATTYNLTTNIATATGTGAVTSAEPKTVLNGALSAGDTVYYLLIYVENDEVQQNAGGSADVTGSYTGEFTLEAVGGSRVQATFSA